MVCKSLFITATGTDVGKTYVTTLIVKKMRDLGFKCGYYKPVLSGLSADVVSDSQYVVNVANLDEDPMNLITYGFKEPVSPHLASSNEGVTVSLDEINSDYINIQNHYDYLCVEGAGGITCPLVLNERKVLLSDLIKFLNLNVLLVADAGLGTLNSTLLTVEFAKSNNILVKGIILNNFDETNLLHCDNLNQIKRLTGVDVVATVASNASDIEIDEDILKGLFE